MVQARIGRLSPEHTEIDSRLPARSQWRLVDHAHDHLPEAVVVIFCGEERAILHSGFLREFAERETFVYVLDALGLAVAVLDGHGLELATQTVEQILSFLGEHAALLRFEFRIRCNGSAAQAQEGN